MNMLINIITEKELNLFVNSGKSYYLKVNSNNNTDNFFVYFFFVLECILLFGAYSINNPFKEKLSKIKYILYLNGNNKLSYWIGIFFSDFIKILIIVIMFLILFQILSIEENYNFIHCLFFLSLISVCLLSYLISLIINKHSTALYFVFGNSVLLLFLMFRKQSDYFILFIYLCPFITFFYKINCITSQWFFYCHHNYNNRYFFIFQIIIYSVVIIIIESKICFKIKQIFKDIIKKKEKNNYTENVVILKNDLLHKEINYDIRIESLKENKSKLNNNLISTKFINVSKSFYKCCCCKKKQIINNFNLELEENEKYGLLGLNGAGKSTLFKLITNQINYDSGEIYLFNNEVKKDFDSIRKTLGYCPQENIIFNGLTVKQIFKYFKELRNITMSIKEMGEKYGLNKYLNTKYENLSGGNKRKLCFAISIMNKPKILLLDEPSTGVDPESRRIMWKNILELNLTHKYNMILSTHSMEEAEVLCDTISWLKEGKFKCIGNSEELKIKYSAGYVLQLKIKKDENNNINDNCNKLFDNLESKIQRCDKLGEIKNNYNYLNKLNIIFDSFKDYYDCCYINEVFFDNYSFEFIIKIKEGNESHLFSRILNLKNNFDFIEEVCIQMESLENILLRL